MTRATTEHTPRRARIPADVDRPDRILAGLTARQLAIVAAAGVGLWLAYQASRGVVPPLGFAVGALPVAGVVAALVLGTRDGLGLDRWLASAVRFARCRRRLVAAPQGAARVPAWVHAPGQGQVLPAPLRLPAHALRDDGTIDLGAEGVAALAEASTVSFGLRSGEEQQQMVAAFRRWLASSGPVQILVRAERVDLTPTIQALNEAAPGLPHPALETAAREHAGFLADLAAQRDLLRRRVVLVIREPHPGGHRDAAEAARRARRRCEDAARSLAAAGVAVTVLDAAQAAHTLATACDPLAWPHRPGGLAAPDEVITTRNDEGGRR